MQEELDAAIIQQMALMEGYLGRINTELTDDDPKSKRKMKEQQKSFKALLSREIKALIALVDVCQRNNLDYPKEFTYFMLGHITCNEYKDLYQKSLSDPESSDFEADAFSESRRLTFDFFEILSGFTKGDQEDKKADKKAC